ncbi:DUF6973 domain-containing protein [Gordonia terrae]
MYNSAWAQTWAASNGRPASEAPPPPVPYVCHDPGPTTTTTSQPPVVTAPTVPSDTNVPEGPGPNVGAHAPTDIPPPGSTPIVPIPGQRAPSPTRSSDDGSGQPNPVVPQLQPTQADGSYPGADKNPLNKLGPNERNACLSNPYDCNRSRNAGDDAQAKADSVKYFPGQEPESTRQDAARHCIWQGLTTESANADFAKAMGDAHEADSGSPIPGSSVMDVHNNIVGRSVGRRYESDRVSIVRTCVDLARGAQKWDPTTAPTADDSTLIFILGK